AQTYFSPQGHEADLLLCCAALREHFEEPSRASTFFPAIWSGRQFQRKILKNPRLAQVPVFQVSRELQ
ncbi:MAG: hypothetical protein WAK13_20195, partial [Terriglobales bacterium]